MNVKLTWALAGKIITALGLGGTLVWGAANQVRNVTDNSKEVTSLKRKTRRMSLGIRQNRDDIRYMIIMQEAQMRRFRIPLPPKPEPEILEYDDEVKNARD